MRALRVLQSVDRMLCEDTRHAHTLLARYGIRTPTSALHEHNEARSTPALLDAAAGGRVARARERRRHAAGLRSRGAAGAGGRRRRRARDPRSGRLGGAGGAGGRRPARAPEHHPRVPAAEGQRAAATAALGRGLSARGGALRGAHRGWRDTLRDLAEVAGGDRAAVVARELTKRFEEFRRGTLDVLAAYYSESPPRGEIVIVLAAAPPGGGPHRRHPPAIRRARSARGRAHRPRRDERRSWTSARCHRATLPTGLAHDTDS